MSHLNRPAELGSTPHQSRTVLVTGGAGSIGKVLVRNLLADERVHAVRVFDNNEYGLFQLGRELKTESQRLRMLLGDIQDRDRVAFAMRGVDTVYHIAAVKNVEITEYNAPMTIGVNVDGTMKLVEHAQEQGVKKFIYLSSDKSVNTTTTYGASKLLSERLVMWANRISNTTRFSICRFGNVLETRGNVLDVWREEVKKSLPLTVTDSSARRYYWHVQEAAVFLMNAEEVMEGGEIFITKPENMKQLTVDQLRKEYFPDSQAKVVGMRKDEDPEQLLWTPWEEAHLEDLQWAYRIRDGAT